VPAAIQAGIDAIAKFTIIFDEDKTENDPGQELMAIPN